MADSGTVDLRWFNGRLQMRRGRQITLVSPNGQWMRQEMQWEDWQDVPVVTEAEDKSDE